MARWPDKFDPKLCVIGDSSRPPISNVDYDQKIHWDGCRSSDQV